jgi:hypothetical protein
MKYECDYVNGFPIIAHGKSSRRWGWNVFAAYKYIRFMRSWNVNAYLRFSFQGIYIVICGKPLTLWQKYTSRAVDGMSIGKSA